MIKIITNNELEQKQFKEILMTSGGLCPWYSTNKHSNCPVDENNKPMRCEECINKNIKWKIKKK